MEGNAQEIPIYAKVIITILCLGAVVLTAAWGKIMDWAKSKLRSATKKVRLPDTADDTVKISHK